MLHKNLPAGRRAEVMFIRYFMDYLAALQKMLSGDFKEALAIVRARFEYSHMCHEFDMQRDENLREAVVVSIPEMRPKSILWCYYVKGVRKFSQL